METTCCKIFFFMYGHSPLGPAIKKHVKIVRSPGRDSDQTVEDGATVTSWRPRVNVRLSVWSCGAVVDDGFLDWMKIKMARPEID